MNAFTSLILDPYERTARLGPALIVLLPLLLFAITVQILSKPIMTQITALFGACGMIFLLSSMARMLGKAQEVTLYKSWGGMPTTQLLRHRDSIIDPMTKQRYHDFLARKLKITFPTASEEQTNPESADDCYRAGVKWLIGKTGDRKKFNLLAKENISYGFHRNGYGVRYLGMICVGLAFICLGLNDHFIDPVNQYFFDLQALLESTSSHALLLLFLVGIAALWGFYFTKNRVKHAAFAYADMLLRSCDALR